MTVRQVYAQPTDLETVRRNLAPFLGRDVLITSRLSAGSESSMRGVLERKEDGSYTLRDSAHTIPYQQNVDLQLASQRGWNWMEQRLSDDQAERVELLVVL